MNDKYYIISPFSELDYSFVSSKPKGNSNAECLISPKDAYFYRNSLKLNVKASPYCQFDIHNRYLRSLSASESPKKYFKDRQLISESDSRDLEKMLYGTNNPKFKLDDHHIKSILKKSGSSFTPWFLSRGETSGLSQGRQTFGCFGNDYLIVKLDGDLPYYSWAPASEDSTRLDSALILNKDLNIRGDEYSWMYDNEYKEANTKSFDWGNLSLDSRIFNNFSHSWFHNELQGPFSGNKNVVSKSFGNCESLNDCNMSFFIMGEIESLDDYKEWVKNNYSKKQSNLLNKDYRWEEENIPSINIADINQKQIAISPANPILVHGLSTRSAGYRAGGRTYVDNHNFLSTDDITYSPVYCPQKWERVEDGSAICISEEFEQHQICFEGKKGINLELIPLEPRANLKLNYGDNETVKIPSTFEVKRSGSSDTVKIRIELYPSPEDDFEDCSNSQVRKTRAKLTSRFLFHPHFVSENDLLNNKIKIPRCYFENNTVFTFDIVHGSSRIYLDEAIALYRSELYCALKSFAGNSSAGRYSSKLERALAMVSDKAEALIRRFKFPTPAIKTRNLQPHSRGYASSSYSLNLDELYYPGSESSVFDNFHQDDNGNITPIIESKISPSTLISRVKPTRSRLTANVFNENKISSGIDFTMYINESGILLGSGDNSFGQMGLGAEIDNSYEFSPISVGDNSIIVSCKEVFCGRDHSLVIKEDGSLWGSGSNAFGQLGQENLNNFENFVKIHDPLKDNLNRHVVNASAGSFSTHYVLSDGSLWGLGLNESFKVCHFNSSKQFSVPIEILDRGVSQVCSGLKFITFIKDNKLYIQGGKHNNTELNIIDSEVTRCAAGRDHVIFVKQNSVWGFGDSKKGQLRSFTTDSSRPILSINESGEPQISKFLLSSFKDQGVSDVSSSWASESSLILNRAGEVYFLGRNDYGLSREKGYMLEVPGSPSFKSLSTSLHHSAYIDNSGNVLTQGSNASGQLGNGNPKGRTFSPEVVSFSTYYTPTPVAQITSLKNLFCLFEGSIYLIKNKKLHKLNKENGEEKIEEININKQCLEIHSGEMGVFCIAYDGDREIYSIEKIESEFTELNIDTIYESNKKINDLSVGFSHVLFSDEDLDLWGFGSNESYALGLNLNNNFYKTPERISQNTKSFSAGYKNSIFVSKGKGVDYLMGVGDNSYGRMGIQVPSGRLLKFDDLSEIREVGKSPQLLETLSKKSIICSVLHKELGGIKSVGLSDFNSAILCGNGKVFVGGFNNYNQIPSLSNSPLSNDSRNSLRAGVRASATAEFLKAGNHQLQNFYSEIQDSLNSNRFENINGISNFKKIECKKAFLLLLGQDNTLYGSGQNSHDASSSKISKSFISGSLGDSDLQDRNLTVIARNVKTFESNVFGTITLSSFNHSSSILSSGSYNVEVGNKSFSSIFSSKENSSGDFLSFFNSTSEASYSSDFNRNNLLNIKTEDEPLDMFAYTSKGSLEEKFKTLDGLDYSEAGAAIDIVFINKGLAYFDKMISSALTDRNSFSEYLLIGSRSTVSGDFLKPASDLDYICDGNPYRPRGLNEAISYRKAHYDYYRGHDAEWLENCDMPPVKENESQARTRFARWNTEAMVPYKAKKTNIQSPECDSQFVWSEPSFGTPTPIKVNDTQQILLSCDYFVSSYGEIFHEAFILSPGEFAIFSLDGMLHDNTSVKVDYLGLGSAIINTQPTGDGCDTYNQLEIKQISGNFDWNKGDATCSTKTETGCTDPEACDYNSNASDCSEVNSSSDDCDFSCYGCMESDACNFDDSATKTNGDECIHTCYGCRDSTADNFDDTATRDCDSSAAASTGCSQCSYTYGCQDTTACNFNPDANRNCAAGSTSCEPCDFTSCAQPDTWFKYINCETSDILYTSGSLGEYATKVEEEE